jgi:hypothetical protein
MPMSKDRVQFKLGGRGEYCVGIPPKNREILAARKAFGLSEQMCCRIDHSRTTIICRPSQFARFMIYRNDLGGANSFEDLEPKLIPARREEPFIDVSGAPAIPEIGDTFDL